MWPGRIPDFSSLDIPLTIIALFIVPYFQVVFGLECAIRSFRAIPFQARGKYDVTICCSVVLIMLIATWVPSHIYPEPDTCFASLLWFVTKYGKLGFILLTTSASLMIISALTIFIRLSCVNLVDEHQRITASRIVYYLVVGIVSLVGATFSDNDFKTNISQAFVIPFFFSLIHKGGDIKLSMMATVVLNLSGLMNGLLQLFLRSNTQTTSFGAKPKRSWDLGKHDVRIFGPNELAMHAQLMNPVTGPQTPGSDVASRWADSRASLVGVEKERAISMDSLTKKTYVAEMSSMPPKQEPAVSSSISRGHAQKPSYSIFPCNQSTPTKPPQTTSVYDISDLEPPPAIHFPDGPRHKRDSSVVSSATVQIGLRLSHAPRPSQEDINTPSTTYKAKTAESNTLALPSTTYKPASSLPISKFSAAPVSPATVSAPPLKVDTIAPALKSPSQSPQQPSLLNTNTARSPDQSPTRQAAAVNKTLPPTPKFVFPKVDNVQDSNTQLSPAVYAPERKITTPGVATLVGGPRSATVPPSNPLRANPLGSQTVTRSNSGRAQPATQPSSKDAWI
jgi:hypothetical protein